MQQPTLKATLRDVNASVKQLRRDQMMPAVIYGKGNETQSIAVNYRDFDRLLRTFGQSSLIKVDVDGEVTPALIREVQRDTLKDTILHADFLRVSLDEEIQFELPIILKGDAEGVKMGGVLQHQKRMVAAKSLARYMPESVEIDISNLNIGDTLTVGDIAIDEKVEILDDPEEVIVSVLAPRVEEPAEEAEEGEEEAAPEATETEE